jgi:DNA adenine methylase
MPRHLHYVEPFAGGLAVLLERDPNDKRLWMSEDGNRGGVSEVANDLNGELMNFWRVLQRRDAFAAFQQQVGVTPLSHEEFNRAQRRILLEEIDINHAVKFFVAARQSRAGTFRGFTSLTRSRTRRGINGNASEWLGAVEGLPAVHARLLPVVVENMDAMKLIPREDTPDTLFYCDPPYLHETRATKDAYACEMTSAEHAKLLRVLQSCKGKVMLSGYHSSLYDAALSSWRCEEFDLPNNAAGGNEKRRMTECLWMNF